MFEFHGWFNVRESLQWPEIQLREHEIVASLEQLVSEFGWTEGGPGHSRPAQNGVIDLGYMNGSYFLHLRGHMNHRGSYWTDIQTLLEWICREAPGSFGMLYWRDDEGELPAGANNFQVIVMARGQVTTRLDPFLSPAVPVTEDAWDGSS